MSEDDSIPHPAKAPRHLWAKLKPSAREKRHDPTSAEDHLWQRLCNRQVAGAKFRRQHVIERFIVDFYCADARLIVEVDGPIHDYTPEEDEIRQEFLKSLGFLVLRFSNDEVMGRMNDVIATIKAEITRSPHPPAPSPYDGEGEQDG